MPMLYQLTMLYELLSPCIDATGNKFGGEKFNTVRYFSVFVEAGDKFQKQ